MKKKLLSSGPRTAVGRLAADMLRRYYTHDVARDSAALTYYLLFAIFPLLIFISALLGLLDLDIAYITSVLEPLLPADVLGVVQSYLEYVSANQSRQLLWFSLVFSIWFPMRATGCLMHSLRKAFGQPTPESMWRSQWRILLFTIWLIVVIAVTLVLVSSGGGRWSSRAGSSPCRRASSRCGAICASSCWRWSSPCLWCCCTGWPRGGGSRCGRSCPACAVRWRRGWC